MINMILSYFLPSATGIWARLTETVQSSVMVSSFSQIQGNAEWRVQILAGNSLHILTLHPLAVKYWLCYNISELQFAKNAG